MSCITILGIGNGGQALAGYFAAQGHDVRLYGRSPSVVEELAADGTLCLSGALSCVGRAAMVSDDLAACVTGAELIMVVTTANAHRPLAYALAPMLVDGQTVVLNPGRTLGAFEVRRILKETGCKANVMVAEAQSLVFACRITDPGKIHVYGVKKGVPIAAYPKNDTAKVLESLNACMPNFIAANSVLETGLENIGAVFHPLVVLLNAATIERGQGFLFYNDMTGGAARAIQALDCERRCIGRAYGINLRSAEEWVTFAYGGTSRDNLCQRMRNNSAYSGIKSPAVLASRYLTEDIPTGIVPMIELASVAGVKTPLMESVLALSQALTGLDLHTDGRTLRHLGLYGKTTHQIGEALKA